jgi:Cu/Ag efflux pump CusA
MGSLTYKSLGFKLGLSLVTVVFEDENLYFARNSSTAQEHAGRIRRVGPSLSPAPLWGLPSGRGRSTPRWASRPCAMGTQVRAALYLACEINMGGFTQQYHVDPVGAQLRAFIA